MGPTRLLRISAANIGPNRFHQNRTVSWLMSIPRSAKRSSTWVVTLANFTCLYSVLEPHPLEQFQPLNFAKSRLKMAFTCSM